MAKGPFKLVTVNTAPERAKRLIGRVVVDVQDTYTIDYVANAESTSTLFRPESPDWSVWERCLWKAVVLYVWD
jgi:hypothetical protein